MSTEDKELSELSKEEALDNFREMVGYIMQIDDKEIIDNYANTFMLIAEYYKTRACKEQREICAKESREWWEIANSNIGGTMGKYPNALNNDIVTAPSPK